MRFCKLLVILVIISIVCGGAFWRSKVVGSHSYFYGVDVGDGRNDGIQRVYTGTMYGDLVEWTYNNGSWTMEECGTITQGGYLAMLQVTVGDGRGTGEQCVYVACGNGYLYEFQYNQGSWNITNIGGALGWIPSAAVIGEPRNDGVVRVCGSGYQSTKEFTWNGSDWDEYSVAGGNFDIWAVSIGKGRNNDSNRIYCSDGMGSNNCIREYSWNGINYTESILNAPTQMIKTAIGDGRNDGVTRVYGSGRNGHIHEFTFQGGIWSRRDIHESAPNKSRYGLVLDNPNIDEQNHLYSVAQLGDFREHSWTDDSAWEDITIDAITGATANLNVGKGRNDNKKRVYVVGSNGFLYEYSHIDDEHPATISGSVSSSMENIVIEDGTILYNEETEIIDISGNYNLNLIEGFYNLEFNAPGHARHFEMVEPEPSEIIEFDVILEYLTPPTNLECSIEVGMATLNWSFENSEDEDFTGFNIFRKIEENEWELIDVTNGNEYSTNITDNIYQFYVTADYIDGESYPSEIITINPTGVDEQNNSIINQIDPYAYPNPFSLSSKNRSSDISIEFYLHEPECIAVDVYNVKGQKIKNLIDEKCKKGKQNVTWSGKTENGDFVPSGIYFYRINGEKLKHTDKILIVE